MINEGIYILLIANIPTVNVVIFIIIYRRASKNKIALQLISLHLMKIAISCVEILVISIRLKVALKVKYASIILPTIRNGVVLFKHIHKGLIPSLLLKVRALIFAAVVISNIVFRVLLIAENASPILNVRGRSSYLIAQISDVLSC